MAERRPIGPVDTMWLNMDRPNNLMVIDSVMWFDEPMDWDRLTAVLRRRLLEVYPVFSQRPHPALSPMTVPHWEDDPDFEVARHLRRVTLPEPGDEGALQRYVERQMHRPLPRNHPLWECHFIDGYGSGSAMLTRFHHSLADGIALAQVLLSLTDGTPTADLEDLESGTPAPHHAGLLDAASMLTRAATSAARSGLHMFAEVPQLARPSFVVDALTLLRQTGEISNKLLLGSNPRTLFSGGSVGVQKRAVWSAPRPLADVKRIGRLTGATVNDVLVGAVSGAIHGYLRDTGGDPTDLSTMVPVNVRPLDRPLPRELGNRFALVLLPLPTGASAPLLRVAESKRRMDSIKHSPEAVITFGLIATIGRMTPRVEKLLVDFFSSKAIGVTTNVVGPNEPRYLAGVPIAGVVSWVPGSGTQVLGVSIFSYAQTVRVGFKADASTIADPEKLVHAFDEEMDTLLRIAAAA